MDCEVVTSESHSFGWRLLGALEGGTALLVGAATLIYRLTRRKNAAPLLSSLKGASFTVLNGETELGRELVHLLQRNGSVVTLIQRSKDYKQTLDTSRSDSNNPRVSEINLRLRTDCKVSGSLNPSQPHNLNQELHHDQNSIISIKNHTTSIADDGSIKSPHILLVITSDIEATHLETFSDYVENELFSTIRNMRRICDDACSDVIIWVSSAISGPYAAAAKALEIAAQEHLRIISPESTFKVVSSGRGTSSEQAHKILQQIAPSEFTDKCLPTSSLIGSLVCKVRDACIHTATKCLKTIT